MDLSVIIPARNEEWLAHTICNVLDNIQADTEIIAILDGYWPDPPVYDHPRVTLIHHSGSIGQRAAVNEGARLSRAKYIMKLDAHCTVSEGFDKAMMEVCKPDWTVIPRMSTLHVFDWVCEDCGARYYQGPRKVLCDKRDKDGNDIGCGCNRFRREVVFKPTKKRTDFMWFDKDLVIGYFDKNYLGKHGDVAKLREMVKPRNRQLKLNLRENGYADVMCGNGACWLQTRERFWELGGLDEKHGSWGQVAVEVACKAWLSGGRQVVTSKASFSHLFRTQTGFSFPYPQDPAQKDRARKYSRKLWLRNTWPKQTRKLDWLVDHFGPLPSWNNVPADIKTGPTKGVVYYTDNQLDQNVMKLCLAQLKDCLKSMNGEMENVVSVSRQPIDLGRNVVMDIPRCSESIFKQILKGLKHCKAEVIYLCEHDILYRPSHFWFTPPRKDRLYYNQNFWYVDLRSGHCLYHHSRNPSFLVAYRDLLVDWYSRVNKIIKTRGYNRSEIGFAPGARKIKDMPKYKLSLIHI